LNRPAKITLWVVLILVALVLGATVVVRLVFTKERILAMLTPRIEAAISRPVTIGDAGISLWGGIGVWIGDVTIGNHPGFSDESFLVVHRIEFKARFWPLLAGKVELDRVLLESPSLLLEYNAAGESNLRGLFAQSGESAPSAPSPDTATAPIPDESALLAPVTVDHFILSNGELVVVDADPPRRIRAEGLSVDLRTGPGEGPGLTRFHADLAIDTLAIERADKLMTFGQGNPRAGVHGQVDLRQKFVNFDSVSLHWFGAVLGLQGGVRVSEEITEVQLKANLSPTSLTEIAAQLAVSGVVEQTFDIQGTVEGDGEVGMLWPLPEGTVPDWNARLDLQQVLWRPEQLVDTISIPRMELRGEGRSVSWSLPAATVGGGSISGFGALDRVFSDAPEFSGRLKADIPASLLNTYLPEDQSLSIAGRIETELNAFGGLKNWKNMRITGPLKSSDLLLIDPTWSVDTIDLAIEWDLDGRDVHLRRTVWKVGRSSGSLTGTVVGIIPAALHGFDTPDVPRADLAVYSPYLDFDELMEEGTAAAEPPAESGAAESADSTTGLPLPAMSADGQITCDTVVYSKMTLTSVSAPFSLRDNVFTFDPISARVYGGRGDGACRWDVNDWEEPSFAVRATADSIEANEFLSRYLGWAGGVFGQFTFRGEFVGQGREAVDILPNLGGGGKITMDHGRLEAAPLMQAVGGKLGVTGMSQARAIRDAFVNFHIRNGRVITDTLEVASDEGRWFAMGSFGFDNSLDYVVNLKLSDAAARQVSSALAGANLRIGITGTVTSPTITLDLAEVGKSVVEKLLKPALADTASLKRGAEDLLKGLLKKKP